MGKHTSPTLLVWCVCVTTLLVSLTGSSNTWLVSAQEAIPSDALFFYKPESYNYPHWKDLSDSANDGSVNEGRPQLRSVNQRGKMINAIHFSSGDGVTIGKNYLGTEYCRFDNDFTIFIIDRYSGPSRGRTLQSRSPGQNWLMGRASGYNAMHAGRWGYYADLGQDSFALMVAVKKGNHLDVRINGKNIYSANGAFSSPGALGIGRGGGLGGCCRENADFDVLALGGYSRALSLPELEQVENVLNDEFDVYLPAGAQIGAVAGPANPQFLHLAENFKDSIWTDLSTFKNDAVVNSGTPKLVDVTNRGRSKSPFKAIRLHPNQGISLHTSSAIHSAPYTVFVVDRYIGDKRGRTLQSRTPNHNWLLGHWNEHMANYACGWGKRDGPVEDKKDYFHLSIVTLDEKGNYRARRDGKAIGSWKGKKYCAPKQLALGAGGTFNEPSDFDVVAVGGWNRVLNEDEISALETMLNIKYSLWDDESIKTHGKKRLGRCKKYAKKAKRAAKAYVKRTKACKRAQVRVTRCKKPNSSECVQAKSRLDKCNAKKNKVKSAFDAKQKKMFAFCGKASLAKNQPIPDLKTDVQKCAYGRKKNKKLKAKSVKAAAKCKKLSSKRTQVCALVKKSSFLQIERDVSHQLSLFEEAMQKTGLVSGSSSSPSSSSSSSPYGLMEVSESLSLSSSSQAHVGCWWFDWWCQHWARVRAQQEAERRAREAAEAHARWVAHQNWLAEQARLAREAAERERQRLAEIERQRLAKLERQRLARIAAENERVRRIKERQDRAVENARKLKEKRCGNAEVRKQRACKRVEQMKARIEKDEKTSNSVCTNALTACVAHCKKLNKYSQYAVSAPGMLEDEISTLKSSKPSESPSFMETHAFVTMLMDAAPSGLGSLVSSSQSSQPSSASSERDKECQCRYTQAQIDDFERIRLAKLAKEKAEKEARELAARLAAEKKKRDELTASFKGVLSENQIKNLGKSLEKAKKKIEKKAAPEVDTTATDLLSVKSNVEMAAKEVIAMKDEISKLGEKVDPALLVKEVNAAVESGVRRYMSVAELKKRKSNDLENDHPPLGVKTWEPADKNSNPKLYERVVDERDLPAFNSQLVAAEKLDGASMLKHGQTLEFLEDDAAKYGNGAGPNLLEAKVYKP